MSSFIEIHSVKRYRITQNKHYRMDNGRPDGGPDGRTTRIHYASAVY